MWAKIEKNQRQMHKKILIKGIEIQRKKILDQNNQKKKLKSLKGNMSKKRQKRKSKHKNEQA